MLDQDCGLPGSVFSEANNTSSQCHLFCLSVEILQYTYATSQQLNMAEPVDMVPRLHSMRAGKKPPQVDITNRKETLKLCFSLFFYNGWRGSFLRSSVFWMPAVGNRRKTSWRLNQGTRRLSPGRPASTLPRSGSLHPSTPAYLPTYLSTHMDI